MWAFDKVEKIVNGDHSEIVEAKNVGTGSLLIFAG